MVLAIATFEVKRCRFARQIHHPKVAKRIHPQGFEPVITRYLADSNWDGPVWDVGSNVGNIAYEVAQRHRVFVFEPNLNLIYYLGYKLKDCPGVTVVPCAPTLDSQPMQCLLDPNFSLPNNGPMAATLSVEEALKKFGRPGVIKLDIEAANMKSLNHRRLPV